MKYLVMILPFLGLSACMGTDFDSALASLNQDDTAGFASRTNAGSSGPLVLDQSRATHDKNLPYGQLSKACGIRGSALGQPVERGASRRSGYQLYDTKPGASGPRTFYISGFSDKCPRKFTASMAMFADLKMYETIRYGAAAKTLPVSATDRAYEQLKVRVCRVPKNSPCGNKIGKLERNTTFLTVYERFGGNKKWINILLHKGTVVAVDQKS